MSLQSIFYPTAVVLLVAIFLSCSSGRETENLIALKEKLIQNENTFILDSASVPPKAHKISYNANGFTFSILAQNAEMSTVYLSSEGLPQNFSEVFYCECKILGSSMLDLDLDGFKEFYLFSQPTDDSDNIVIIGYTSVNDQKIAQIEIEDTKALRAQNSDKLVIGQYMIIRSFHSNRQALINSYELKKEGKKWKLKATNQ